MKDMSIAACRIRIMEAWDAAGKVCPHNPSGWVAYHYELVEKEKNYGFGSGKALSVPLLARSHG